MKGTKDWYTLVKAEMKKRRSELKGAVTLVVDLAKVKKLWTSYMPISTKITKFSNTFF